MSCALTSSISMSHSLVDLPKRRRSPCPDLTVGLEAFEHYLALHLINHVLAVPTCSLIATRGLRDSGYSIALYPRRSPLPPIVVEFVLAVVLDPMLLFAEPAVTVDLVAGAGWADNGLVFASGKGTPLDAQNIINRHFRPLLKRAGLPDIRWHDLRHSRFTILLARSTHPKYVQMLAGHASIQLTLDRYSLGCLR